MNYPSNIEEKIGFNQIRKTLFELTETELGKEITSSFTFINDIRILETLLAETSEFTDILSFEKGFESKPTSLSARSRPIKESLF